MWHCEPVYITGKGYLNKGSLAQRTTLDILSVFHEDIALKKNLLWYFENRSKDVSFNLILKLFDMYPSFNYSWKELFYCFLVN